MQDNEPLQEIDNPPESIEVADTVASSSETESSVSPIEPSEPDSQSTKSSGKKSKAFLIIGVLSLLTICFLAFNQIRNQQALPIPIPIPAINSAPQKPIREETIELLTARKKSIESELEKLKEVQPESEVSKVENLENGLNVVNQALSTISGKEQELTDAMAQQFRDTGDRLRETFKDNASATILYDAAARILQEKQMDDGNLYADICLRQGIEAKTRNDIPAALKHYKKALAIKNRLFKTDKTSHQDVAETLSRLADAEAQNQDYDSAFKNWKLVEMYCEGDPIGEDILFNVLDVHGLALYKLGKKDEARGVLNKYVDRASRREKAGKTVDVVRLNGVKAVLEKMQ